MIFRGPYPDVTIPEVSLTDFIFGSFAEVKDKPALIDGPTGRMLTYKQFEIAVRRIAAGLSQRGFKKGDVFGIFTPNCPEYAIAFHAVAMLGGVNTTLNPLYTAEEAASQLKNSGAKLLVTGPQFIEKARDAWRLVDGKLLLQRDVQAHVEERVRLVGVVLLPVALRRREQLVILRMQQDHV